MSSTTTDGDSCAICGATRLAHKELNHKFSVNGELETQDPAPKQQARPHLSGIDIPLRLLLIDKGVITAEDLAVKEEQLRDRLRGQNPPG